MTYHFQGWDLAKLTQNYLLLLLHYIKEGKTDSIQMHELLNLMYCDILITLDPAYNKQLNSKKCAR